MDTHPLGYLSAPAESIKAEDRLVLSVVIPCFNEEQALRKTHHRVLRRLKCAFGQRVELTREAAHQHRDEEKGEPDPVEHGRRLCRFGAARGKRKEMRRRSASVSEAISQNPGGRVEIW